jgi:hypothetical protein
MTKRISSLPLAQDAVPHVVELETLGGGRELVSIESLLRDAYSLVDGDVRQRGASVVIVPAPEHVLVFRAQVVFVVASLLRTVVRAVAADERVAITGQSFDEDVVFAVYDSGRRRASAPVCSHGARRALYALRGRVWSSDCTQGNLWLFSVPLQPIAARLAGGRPGGLP